MGTTPDSTVKDLYRVRGKAEIIGGQLRIMEPSGCMHNRAGFNITASLREHERRTNAGYAIGDNAGFTVNLPNRQSFSPDAAFHTGQPTGMKFLDGAPVFAVE